MPCQKNMKATTTRELSWSHQKLEKAGPLLQSPSSAQFLIAGGNPPEVGENKLLFPPSDLLPVVTAALGS